MTENYKVDGFWFMVFNATCKYISFISLSVLLVEGTLQDGSALNHPGITCRHLGHLRYKMGLQSIIQR
jgi:hypothetical protein